MAVHLDRVLWFNDVEDGVDVSRFQVAGEIPEAEYECNQDELRWTLPRLVIDASQRLGPPESIVPE